MIVYPPEIRAKILKLRSSGKTYREIQEALGQKVPKSTLSHICKNVSLSDAQRKRISNLMLARLAENRRKAVAANRKIFEDRVNGYRTANKDIAGFMASRNAKLVAMAMLYLGEGAKWQGSRAPRLGSSSPHIIRLYINLLRECYGVPVSALRARVQHRADQDPAKLVSYWSEATGIEDQNFYPSYLDKRTIGKATKKSDYKGVCTIIAQGTRIQLELEQISAIICEELEGH